MISKLNRSLLAVLILGLAGTTSNGRAAEILSTSADRSSYDSYDSYGSGNCLRNICVGMQVQVVGGQWAGYSGFVTAIDIYQDMFTIRNVNGYYLYPRSYDVSSVQSPPCSSVCVSAICVGDQVRILFGLYSGRTGQVVDTDEYNDTATVLVDGRYLTKDTDDLSLDTRPNYPQPYPSYPRNCPAGTVYDTYRGCVRIGYPYPRPVPPSFPAPVPFPQQPRRPDRPSFPQGPRRPDRPSFPQGPRSPDRPSFPQDRGSRSSDSGRRF